MSKQVKKAKKVQTLEGAVKIAIKKAKDNYFVDSVVEEAQEVIVTAIRAEVKKQLAASNA